MFLSFSCNNTQTTPRQLSGEGGVEGRDRWKGVKAGNGGHL